MAKLIADTNVWYEIGEGTRDPARLKAGGNTLVAIPTSIMEIASPHADEKHDTCPNAEKRQLRYSNMRTRLLTTRKTTWRFSGVSIRKIAEAFGMTSAKRYRGVNLWIRPCAGSKTR